MSNSAATVQLELRAMPGRYAVIRLPADAGIPAWFPKQGFRHFSSTRDETSIVCEETLAPASAQAGMQIQAGWRCMMLQGPFAFELTGILLAVLQPLAAAGVGIFAMSTFDTDYVLVKDAQWKRAVQALVAHGHRMLDADQDTADSRT